MQKGWVVSIRDQCREAGVPFFFKQWGGCRKGQSGRDLDGVTHDELPPRVAGSALPIGERRNLIAELKSE
jgi:protein gp37